MKKFVLLIIGLMLTGCVTEVTNSVYVNNLEPDTEGGYGNIIFMTEINDPDSVTVDTLQDWLKDNDLTGAKDLL